ADHRDPLAFKAHRSMRPARGVAGLALECLDAVDARHGRRRQRTNRGDQEARGVAAAVLKGELPPMRLILPMCRGHPAAKLDVTPEVEPVGDMADVAQRLRLAGEMF